MSSHTGKLRIVAALLAAFLAEPVLAEGLPAIDWSTAGRGEAIETQPLPEKGSDEKDASGLDCETVTHFSHDHRGLRPDSQGNLPSKVKRCGRDGFSLEITAPSN